MYCNHIYESHCTIDLIESDIWNSDYYRYRCTPTTYCNYMHMSHIQLYGTVHSLGPSYRYRYDTCNGSMGPATGRRSVTLWNRVPYR